MVGAVAVVLLLGSIVLVATLAEGGDDDTNNTGTRPGLRVSMTDFAFDPDPITVAGDEAQLLVVNDGHVVHDLVIQELGKGTSDVAVGDEFELDLTGQPPGTYRVICDIPGHLEAGMETEITIG
jgi:uncharacterized cupredoxin-like copper-binding protein